MKTIMITGCSSGFGLETARYFLEHDWNVIATMRTPQRDLLPKSDRLRLLSLDVTQKQSIEHAIEDAGDIDVLVNNAGVGMLNALEGVSPQALREVFETNTLGTIAMTQAVLPQFRQRRSGLIINITSAVTLKPLPLLAAYTASKAAVNAFTESLALELKPFNIRVGLILPGRAPETRFGENAQRIMGNIPADYAELSQQIFNNMRDASASVTWPIDVAKAVWQVANDPSAPMRLPAGEDALYMASTH
ncbi:MAG TPA: short-chain dehydrogenase/reductase [Enterobacteriaceae bacterium]|uniref:SDR family oxidoreductase n=1 Tax=Pseudescherichia sp. TaxID=2055881 RepID=UPI000E89AB1A|nr:SDR family oxidoreductase [Pseudescherichia sp.]HAZ76973.1 short-chain dehydrogenase/reductase [Enterobacteriaceae bacterium]